MKFPLVRDLAAEGFPVRLTCGVLGFSAQAFYKWRARPVSDRDWADAHVTNTIVDVHADDPEFGYRFIADELERAGQPTNERRVWRLCREQRIWSTTTKKGRKGAGKTPGPAVHDDLVRRNFTAARIDAVWLTDITEHPTLEQALRLRDQGPVLEPDRRLRDRRTHDRATRGERVAVRDRTASAGRYRRCSQRQGFPVSRSIVPGCAHQRGLARFHGSRRVSRRQRRDGIVPLALAEERPRPQALADPRRAALRDHPLDRAHLQPSSPSTSTREAHPRRVRTHPRHTTTRSGSMISHNHRQPNTRQTR